MRIIGGSAAGRLLQGPNNAKTRPTGARVREALANSLGPRLAGAGFLDLYGGTGAMSFEALSWGARHVVVVEPRRAAQTIIQANARSLGMTAEMTLMPTSAEKALQMLSIQGQRFDVIFCDPPWERGLSAEVASRIITVLKPNGWCIVEHRAGRPSPTLDQMWCFRPRRYGDTMLSFYEETQGVDR